MKFKTGDTVKVIENGLLKAIIVKTSFNNVPYYADYLVKWEGVSGLFNGPTHSYSASDVDDLWEKVAEDLAASSSGARTITLPEGKGNDLLEKWNHTYRPKKDCEHKWVEVSFAHSTMVCFHCNIEKPKDG